MLNLFPLLLAGAVAAGDDTPIGTYIIIGVAALVLLIVASVLSAASKNKTKNTKKKKKD